MKKIHLTIEDIFNIPTAVIYNPDLLKSVYHVSIDSRNLKKNSLFIAIKGEKFDGHDFIEQAVKNGASAILINQKHLDGIKDYQLPVITVKDTVTALGEIAKIWRKKLNAKVIGITGSAGKTTTKEMLATLLSAKLKVNKTFGNNNNHIGVPLTVLSTTEKHDVLVCELGTNHFGEIAYTASIAAPDFSLITNIGDSHLEFLKNKKGVFKEKVELLNETLKIGGKVFINNDDLLLKEFGKSVKEKISFAVKEKAKYRAIVKGFDTLGRASIEIKYGKNIAKINLPVSGEKNVHNYIAAFAVAAELGLNTEDIIKATAKIKSYNKRLEIKNSSNFTLINDTYNANPDSMKSSLNLLTKIENRKKKIAVLGDMFELGKESKAKHLDLANTINKLNVDEVYSIGKMMKQLDKKLNGKIKTHHHFEDRDLLHKTLQTLDLNNSVILVKGSRGMKMEDFTETILNKKK